MELIAPDPRFRESVRAAAAEFAGARMDGAGFLNDADTRTLADDSAFAELVASLTADARPESARPEGFVPATALWMLEGDEIVGFLQLRHTLSPWLLEQGGHIGYSVRPSARRRGFAGVALAQSLPIARELGIDRVLVVCDETNVGSRAVIEAGGGQYEDSRNGFRRYWISTSA